MWPCANIETSSTASGPLGSDAAFFQMWWLEPRISGAHPDWPHGFLLMSHPRSLFSRFSSLFLFAAIFRSVPQYNPVWSSGGWTGDLVVTPIKVWKHLQDEQETPEFKCYSKASRYLCQHDLLVFIWSVWSMENKPYLQFMFLLCHSEVLIVDLYWLNVGAALERAGLRSRGSWVRVPAWTKTWEVFW